MNLKGLLFASILAILGCGAFAADLPPVPKADYPLIDNFAYPDAAAARAVWKPMGDSAPVEVAKMPAGASLRMPCNFAGTTMERASWDRKLKLDLTMSRGLQFQFFAADVTPVAYFMCYLHSGNGWYNTSFGPTRKAGWITVTIDKSDTKVEGQPAGWGKIDAIRISAWRGRDENTEFAIANLGLSGSGASIVVVRGESSARASRSESAAIGQFARSIEKMLEALKLPSAVVSDLDLTTERLKGVKIVILPHNPAMRAETAATLVRFVEGGGKLVSFFGSLSPELAKAVGIKVGKFVSARDGRLASIRATERGLMGEPAAVEQASWALTHAEPLAGKGEVAAEWFDAQGKATGEPAIVATDRAVHMTHVMLDDDPANKPQLLLAMLGRLAPELWTQVTQSRLAEVGQFGEFKNFDEVRKAIGPAADRTPAARAALADTDRLRGEAEALLRAKKYPEAMAAAGRARDAAVRAWCATRDPKPGEFRGWWSHSAFGPSGKVDWDTAIKTLADQGFTAILPNMLWGGAAFYESELLPVSPEVKTRGDQIALCLAACKKYGVACHVWKVNWSLGSYAPKEFVARMQREGRTQLGFDGKQLLWLCPSNPINQKQEIDTMCEVATKYDVDGVHFDYIRYPGIEGCYCKSCRERFEKSIGKKVANWPADTKSEPAVKAKWLDWRRDNITTVVAGVSARLRKERPNVKISAAVFRNWATDRDSVGQDWKLWCEKGYLDFVCPMDYTESEGIFESQIKQQIGWAGKVPVYPGIGVSVWTPKRDAVKLVDFINIARGAGAGGFTIFQYDETGAKELAPLCGLGITRKE